MKQLGVLLLGWLVLAGPLASRAQDTQLPFNSPAYLKLAGWLPDSVRKLDAQARAGRVAAVARMASWLLARYPGRVALVHPNPYGYVEYFHDDVYPQQVYLHRAEARRQLGDLPGAATDLTQAIRYGELAYPKRDNATYDHPVVAGLRAAYYTRADLRHTAQPDPAGRCADLGRAYQLDTLRASNPRYQDCKLPAARAPLDGSHAAWARQLQQDSVALARQLLAQGRLVSAARVIGHLDAGLAGSYVRLPRPSQQLYELHAQLARQRGNYRQAVAYLDSLLPDNYSGDPRYRYERGILRLDYLHDPGGCDDLRWVYDHDSTRTAPTHPRWRGCPLPARKAPVGNAEYAAYLAAVRDSVAHALALGRAGQGRRGLSTIEQLMTTGIAGRYAPLLEYYKGRASPRLEGAVTNILLRSTRSQLYELLGDYPRAVADLDSLIRPYDRSVDPNGEFHCRRGALLADHLHQPEQACADLTECNRRGGTPPPGPGPNVWRGCRIRERTAAYKFGQTGLGSILYGNLPVPVLRLGYFQQGSVQGAEVGVQLSEAGEPIANYGPSLGLEVGSYDNGRSASLLVAPKLSFEGELLLVGGRVDLACYLGQVHNRLVADPRLTPQVGLSLLGVVNVFYGYAIPLAGPQLDALGRHRLSIYLNFLKIGKLSGKIGG